MAFNKKAIADILEKERTLVASLQKTTGSKYALDTLRFWDVMMPPVKKRLLAGRMLPTAKSAMRVMPAKKRRITIDIYQTGAQLEGVDIAKQNRAKQRKLFTELSKEDLSTSSMGRDFVDDEDLIAFRVLKPKCAKGGDGDEQSVDVGDGDSLSSQSESAMYSSDGSDTKNTCNEWKERCKYRLDSIEIISQSLRSVDLKMGSGAEKHIRAFHFESKQDAESFVKVVNQMKSLQQERARRLTDLHMSRGPPLAPRKNSQHSPAPKGHKRISSIISVDSIFGGSEHYSPPLSNVVVEPSSPPATPELPPVLEVEPTRKPSKMTRLRQRFFSDDSAGTPLLDNNPSYDDPEAAASLCILVEIVSASNLPVANVRSSDPCVIVTNGAHEIHRTKRLSKTLDPVWTLATGSLFLIRTTTDSFFKDSNFISFSVKDMDSFRPNSETLGTVEIHKKKLLEGTGERLVYALVPPESIKKRKRAVEKKSFLALRYRQATEEDVDFMNLFYENKRRKRYAVYLQDSFVPPRRIRRSGITKGTRKGHGKGTVQRRTKPCPDPEREAETTWMTSKELEIESLKPSTRWVEAGSGKLGKVFVEIIRCENLPNLDMSVTGFNKTDAFACLCYEDCLVNTDVINDSLNPLWMPWCQRAFVFNILHPTSQIMIGVFDYDESKNPVHVGHHVHDKVGRTVVNISNFVPGLEYTLDYKLYHTTNSGRKERGTITLRLRVQWEDERSAILAGLSTETNHDISVASKEYFRTVYYTLANEQHPGILSLKTITSHVEELESYLENLPEVEDAILSVLLWRGHYPLTFRVLGYNSGASSFADRWTRSVTINLPLHSIIAFAWGIILARNFDYLPSFLAFSVAWLLLGNMGHVRKHPSPWYRPRSYFGMLKALVLRQSRPARPIVANQNLDNVVEYDARKAVVKKAKKEAWDKLRLEEEKYVAHQEKERRNLEEALLDTSNNDKKEMTNMALRPFKSDLLPAQRKLHQIVIGLRVATSVITWRESHVAFWMVTLAFGASVILAFVPWSFVVTWVFNIFVWTLLGPWMKLVDIFYFENEQDITAEEMKAKLADQIAQRYKALAGETYERELIKESAMKKKDMKKYMFGKFMMRVPVFKEERYHDYPLPSSKAEPYDASNSPPINIVDQKQGQLLVGEMIPKRVKLQRKAIPPPPQDELIHDDLIDFVTGEPNEGSPLLKPDNETRYGES